MPSNCLSLVFINTSSNFKEAVELALVEKSYFTKVKHPREDALLSAVFQTCCLFIHTQNIFSQFLLI